MALQAEVNPVIYAECGGGNENTGFVLRNGKAYISYAGATYGTECEISTNGEKVTLEIACNLNDMAWSCMSAVMNEIYPESGSALIADCRVACESGSSVYANLDTWVESNGVHTKVIYDTNDGTILFVFK